MTARLLHEAGGWIAVDKPPGVATVPARGEDAGASLWRACERERGERLWAVHRLDRDTSGVVLFARRASVHRSLSGAFASGSVRKTYLAFVRGVPTAAAGTIRAPLHPARKGKMRPAVDGEPGALAAATDTRLVATWETPFGAVSLVEAFPRTGRQHQIRVHLRFAGVPLLVDPLYARTAAWPPASPAGVPAPRIARLTLHAWRVELDDPETGSATRVESALPPDLAALRSSLGRT